MAYPDEPQRPLTDAPPPAAEPAPVPPSDAAPAAAAPRASSRRHVLIAGGVLILAFAIALAGYLALVVPGAWWPGAQPRAWTASELALTSGTGAQDGATLVVTAGDATNTVLVTLATDFRSSDFPAIGWMVTGVPEGADVRMVWKSDITPNRTHVAQVTVEAGRLRLALLSRNPAWLGRIKGIALAIRAPLTEPLRIDGVTAKPMGALQIAADRAREWFAFEGFNGASINTITGGADLQDLPLPPLAALAVALATLLLWALNRWLPQLYAYRVACTLAGTFAVAWFALDARWIANLARQTGITLTQYAGKSPHDKHVAAEDGPLFTFIEKARGVLPATPARVFVAANAHYFRGRAAYHLYPHNVWFEPFRDVMPAPAWLKPGDWLLVYQRRGVQYDAAQKSLRWDNGPPVGAELKLLEPGAALFQIR